jgi:hypothetical protein
MVLPVVRKPEEPLSRRERGRGEGKDVLRIERYLAAASGNIDA